jgi:hypothetical protein
MYGALLGARELPPGVDLKRVFVAAILKWIDAGWKLKEFSSRTRVSSVTKELTGGRSTSRRVVEDLAPRDEDHSLARRRGEAIPSKVLGPLRSESLEDSAPLARNPASVTAEVRSP